MKKAVFSQLCWSRVQAGLTWNKEGSMRGPFALVDETGALARCDVELLGSQLADGQERLDGTVCLLDESGCASCVSLQLDLQADHATQHALLQIHAKELTPSHEKASVVLAAAAAFVHWTVHALSMKLGSGWLLQSELAQESLTDRVKGRLLEELLLACELAADSLDDCACCLPPAAGAS